MSKYLIDHTAEYLQAAAEHCNGLSQGDARYEIVARVGQVTVRGKLGGRMQTWNEESTEWEDVAISPANPLIEIIERVRFRLERQAERLAPRHPGDGEASLAK